MRLLIVTQAIDSDNPVLGFFVRWVEEFSKRFETITAIGLSVGRYSFAKNVSVHSLGKEKGPRSSFSYALSFLALAWKTRNEYDAVFVHMNQEYVLIVGPLWKLLGKRVYLWRNHYAGSWLTDLAVFFCDRVFCTSTHSYTAKYKKTQLMPVGVDEELFYEDGSVRVPRSILFLARIAPSKRLEILIDALELLKKRGISFIADIYGDPLPTDADYAASMRARVVAAGLDDSVFFHGGIPHAEAAVQFRSHQVFVNCSPAGMLDKTIFEAALCGAIVFAASDDFASAAGQEYHFRAAEELAQKIINHFEQDNNKSIAGLAQKNSLKDLMEALTTHIV